MKIGALLSTFNLKLDRLECVVVVMQDYDYMDVGGRATQDAKAEA